MKVLIFVKATTDSEAGAMPDPGMFEAMGKYNQELIDAGIMKDGDGLKPTSAGKRVRFDGTNRTVIDGPFDVPNNQVAGYWIWDVKDMAEAVTWVKRCPNPMPGPSEIEIRPTYTEADLIDFLPPEVVAQEAEMRAKLEG
ncbi:YciI family protein [Sphingomonas montanisoli]|uniref:YciI family protein n=1 Tax=Sphingomonas montanisoli TaxID=2606412 RepID=A0A5D9C0K0_9SPHN|nr:YciI family protein [Sphingomonas montanisoli]